MLKEKWPICRQIVTFSPIRKRLIWLMMSLKLFANKFVKILRYNNNVLKFIFP